MRQLSSTTIVRERNRHNNEKNDETQERFILGLIEVLLDILSGIRPFSGTAPVAAF
jgi:hypothetical protein